MTTGCQSRCRPRCPRPVFASGLCRGHYQRKLKRQDVDVALAARDGSGARTNVRLEGDELERLELLAGNVGSSSYDLGGKLLAAMLVRVEGLIRNGADPAEAVRRVGTR